VDEEATDEWSTGQDMQDDGEKHWDSEQAPAASGATYWSHA
jgi:hypothetical protein